MKNNVSIKKWKSLAKKMLFRIVNLLNKELPVPKQRK